MTNLRKGLAMFLAVIMIFSSLSVAGIAADSNECIYTVETYFMDTFGVYPTVPDQSSEFSALSGETVVLNPEAKEGFTFDSAESLVEFTAQSDGSSVGKIYYSRNKYTATYIYEDLLGPQTEESSVYYGSEIPGFEANPSGKPAKQGYNFIMWSLDASEKVEVPATMPAYDINMYPIYEIKTYTYTFDAGEGGSFSSGAQTISYEYTYGDVPEYPETPVMDRMEFVDWDNNLPSTVTDNMTFTAIYNEITYAAIFMDGDVEISYMDGYYYGDIIEEVDIPEGYDAWTLSDGTFITFPYTIERNTVFYASDAPSEYTVRFYLDIDDTDPYEEFTVLQGDEIDFPADPEKTGYIFIGWNSDITVMPDEDVDFVAEWEAASYTVTFDTDGGSEIAPETFEYSKVIELPVIPTKEGFVFAGWDGLPEDGLMPAEDITVTAKWEKTIAADSLSFKTEIYSLDEATGEWVVADKVERGETVKARIFIETGFAVGTGQVLCFFNDDVFTSEDISGAKLVVNTSATSTTGKYSASGSYATPSKSHTTFTDLVDFGYISEEFLENHSPVTFTFSFASFKCHSISGDEWFAEFELTAKEDAVGMGNFFVVPETIANSEEGYYAYIDLSKGEEGGSSLSTESLFSWNPSSTVESKPVSTGYGRIIFDAYGGTFSSDNSETLVVDAEVGESVTFECPSKQGYLFYDWDCEIPALMTEEIINTKAVWVPCTDTPFTVVAHYYDFTDGGEGVYTDNSFEFTGTTGNLIEIVEEIPANPDENTEYILIDNLGIEYNELDINAENILSSHVEADGNTVLELYFIPVTHVIIFDSDSGEFSDGDTVKYIEAPHGSLAADYQPYSSLNKYGYTFNGWYGLGDSTRIISDITFKAKWIVNVYDAVFDANGGQFADGSSEIISTYEYNSPVYTPDSTPAKDGYKFIGWTDENGTLYSQGDELGLMPVDGASFRAEWAEIINIYQVTFDANGGTEVLETVAEAGETIILPSTQLDGYLFAGWYDNNGKTYLAGESFVMPEYDVIFTAIWEDIPVETTTETTTELTTKEEEPSTTEPVTEPSATTEPSTTDPVTEPSAAEPTTKPTTQPTTKPTTVHNHSLKTVVENATCEKAGKRYQVCNDCGKTVGSSTVIPALGHAAGDWQTVTEPTYEKEGKKIKKCTRNGCGKILEEASVPVLEPEMIDFSIKTPSRTTINYGDSIYLHAVVDLPAGAEVIWEASNSNFTYSTSADGKTCLISPASNGETEFTAKVVDRDRNVISEICTQKMTSKAGFFQKIIAFFKKLFGLTKVYPDGVKTVYDK